MSTPPRPKGPGLAKALPRPFQTRTATLVRGVDGAIAERLRTADPCSEGATAGNLSGDEAWFGSTSFVVPVADIRARAPWVDWASGDVHLKLRAIRIALGEAVARAPAPLGTAKCDYRVAETASGVRIDVDIEAPLVRDRKQQR